MDHRADRRGLRWVVGLASTLLSKADTVSKVDGFLDASVGAVNAQSLQLKSSVRLGSISCAETW